MYPSSSLLSLYFLSEWLTLVGYIVFNSYSKVFYSYSCFSQDTSNTNEPLVNVSSSRTNTKLLTITQDKVYGKHVLAIFLM